MDEQYDDKNNNKWVPFRFIIHECILEDSDLCRKEGELYVIDFKLPVECSNSVILCSDNNPPDTEVLDRAKLLCYEHFVINNWDSIEELRRSMESESEELEEN